MTTAFSATNDAEKSTKIVTVMTYILIVLTIKVEADSVEDAIKTAIPMIQQEIVELIEDECRDQVLFSHRGLGYGMAFPFLA